MAGNEINLEALKSKHGEVLEVDLDGTKIYLKRPDKKTVGLAIATGRNNPLGMVEVILRNCQVAGPDVSEDVGALVGLSALTDEIIGVKIGQLKNC